MDPAVFPSSARGAEVRIEFWVKGTSEIFDMSKQKIRIYQPDGTLLESHRDRTQDWQQFRQDSYHWWRTIPCPDPRYGRIEDLETGDELFVRHSSDRGARMVVVLKKKRKARVVRVLANYDRRSLNGFCYACVAADEKLARMAGLLPATEDQGTEKVAKS